MKKLNRLGNALLTTVVIVCFTFLMAVIVVGVLVPTGGLNQMDTTHRVAAPTAQR